MGTVQTETSGAGTRGWGLTPATVPPGCFASVMATGIMSVGAHIKGFGPLALILFSIACALYACFAVLVVWRAVRFRDRMIADLHDPARSFGFFTFIAGTNVLAVALEGIGHVRLALVLFAVGLIAWTVLGYLIPFASILAARSRPVLRKVNGTWFVWVVATQSVAVVATGLAQAMSGPGHGGLPDLGEPLSLIAICTWTIGVGLYAACAVFVGLRALLYRLGPGDLEAPYWVTMGALAISIVTGSRIIVLEETPMLAATKLLISGSSAALWAFATWLIPALVFAGWWRHVQHRIPLGYSASLWSMVFPAGMYAVASMYLGEADSIPIAAWIGAQWYWVALAVWTIVFTAMVISFVRSIGGHTVDSARAPGAEGEQRPAGRSDAVAESSGVEALALGLRRHQHEDQHDERPDAGDEVEEEQRPREVRVVESTP